MVGYLKGPNPNYLEKNFYIYLEREENNVYTSERTIIVFLLSDNSDAKVLERIVNIYK
jgi:hypothetical protein